MPLPLPLPLPQPRAFRSLLTGLAALDHVTGGGIPGDLWVVSGPAGVGKTILTLGMARAVALRAQAPVLWLSSNEEPETLAALVVSAEARLTVQALHADDLSSDEQARLAAAQGKIDRARMTFTQVPAGRLLSAARGSTPEGGSLLVLDFVSPCDSDTVADLKSLAEATGTWLVVVARDAGKGRRAARPTVRAGADLHLWIEREDQHEPGSPRCGEADLWVTRADRSRATMVTVAHQGHYSRFVSIGTV